MYRLLLAALLTTAAASATSITYQGILVNESPTFNRPSSTTTLSGVGTNVFYDVHTFNLLADVYQFETVDPTNLPPDNDTVLMLYLGAFNPASPLTNLIAYNDDGGAGLLSLIGPISLAAGQYNIVTATFDNGVTGSFTTTITSVPEPSTVVLSLAGLGFIMVLRRCAPARA